MAGPIGCSEATVLAQPAVNHRTNITDPFVADRIEAGALEKIPADQAVGVPGRYT